ncbi:MAG TPA: hypothetical protein VD815_08240 [Candidatus Saccharimonadales bacterium]|nr:hypothetical protein [Candidatus Saccharimonadales bacterium]
MSKHDFEANNLLQGKFTEKTKNVDKFVNLVEQGYIHNKESGMDSSFL